MKGPSGRKPKRSNREIQDLICSVALHRRQTERAIAQALHILRATVYFYLVAGLISRVSSLVKPPLTVANVTERLAFNLSHIQSNGLSFGRMMNFVHSDEKWFFLTRIKKTYYLLPNEEPPH